MKKSVLALLLLFFRFTFTVLFQMHYNYGAYSSWKSIVYLNQETRNGAVSIKSMLFNV